MKRQAKEEARFPIPNSLGLFIKSKMKEDIEMAQYEKGRKQELYHVSDV